MFQALPILDGSYPTIMTPQQSINVTGNKDHTSEESSVPCYDFYGHHYHSGAGISFTLNGVLPQDPEHIERAAQILDQCVDCLKWVDMSGIVLHRYLICCCIYL